MAQLSPDRQAVPVVEQKEIQYQDYTPSRDINDISPLANPLDDTTIDNISEGNSKSNITDVQVVDTAH